jgi:hypothetical protein
MGRRIDGSNFDDAAPGCAYNQRRMIIEGM